MTVLVIVVVILVVVAVAFMAVRFQRTRRSKELRDRFGPEYDRAVGEYGDPSKAEPALLDRQKRVEKLNIVSLPQPDQERFAQEWQRVQAHFVDDPGTATTEADRLVGQVMQARGYPVGDFEQRAADISVDHADVVDNYRAAHDIALRQQQGNADTEDLRKALIHYRALFEELLERPAIQQPESGAAENEQVETQNE